MERQAAQGAAVAVRPGRHQQVSWLDRNVRFVLLVPAIAYFLILGIFPTVFSLYLAFSSFQPGSQGIQWVGLQNLQTLIHDTRFFNALLLTIIYVVLVVGAELILGTIIAMTLQRQVWGRSFFRLAFILPMLLTPIAIAFTWKMMFDFNRGPLNFFIKSVGLEPVQWIAGRETAILSIAMVDVWQWTPFVALAMLAALESMPIDLYEAAVVDGASFWGTLLHITLPLIQPYAVAIVLLRAVDAFKVFDTVFVLTGGGPGTATEVVNFYLYQVGWRNFNIGYTAAMAWVLLIVMSILFTFYVKAFRRAPARVEGG
jgi:multiple sugar transport system permease protein